MLEQVTQAIVLDKECTTDAHVRVHLFTKDAGKIVAKAVSARKITSKLGAHLEPLSVSTVRFVQKNHLPMLIDALRFDKLPLTSLLNARIVRELAPEWEPDEELWEALSAKVPLTPSTMLAILGYDPTFAACEWCGGSPDYFSFRTQLFLCVRCVPQYAAVADCVRLHRTV
jgi:recombinational DNA repair protein (RecF pathway)